MDVQERLTYEESVAPISTASEHLQRYELAALMIEGMRVLDLCCGTGYGTELLSEVAAHVVGVDRDAATIDAASARFRSLENAEFRLADATAFLEESIQEFDAVVCFEGLEHLQRLDRTLEILADFASGGGRVIASVPNSKTFDEENPYHLTDFDLEHALDAFSRFPEHTVLTQHMIEGGLIRHLEGDHDQPEVRLVALERVEAEYANHFLLLSNCGGGVAGPALRAFVSAAPVHNRYMRSLEVANAELRRFNAQLSRGLIGRSGSGAAKAHTSRLAALEQALAEREREVDELKGRVREERRRGDEEHVRRLGAEARIDELESVLREGPLEAALYARRIRR